MWNTVFGAKLLILIQMQRTSAAKFAFSNRNFLEILRKSVRSLDEICIPSVHFAKENLQTIASRGSYQASR